MYLDISDGQKYKKLIKKGRASQVECFDAWERLIVQQSKATGDLTYSNYFSLNKAYAKLISTYTFVRACFLKLSYTVDRPLVARVAEFGYRIELTPEGYATSLNNAMLSSRNLWTKITAKGKQIDEFKKKAGGSSTLGQIVARTNAALEYKAIDANVLLSEYNECVKIINEKKKQDGRGRSNK